MKELQRTYNCKTLLSAPCHPQTNGLDESSNKTIKRYLMKMLDTNGKTGMITWNKLCSRSIFGRDHPLDFQLLS